LLEILSHPIHNKSIRIVRVRHKAMMKLRYLAGNFK